jgi:hypothetical protein
MNCLRAEELLSDHLDGTLHEVLRGELDTHLASCVSCRPLLDALGEVMHVLQAARARLAGPEMEPAPDLAARAASAALSAGRRPARLRAWSAAIPARLQTLAAGIALLGTATVLAGRTALEHRWPQRLVSEAATAGVHVIERKDRAVEDLRLLRVVVGATFAGRVDRVTDRVDDYRRLLERRRAARPQDTPGPREERAPSPGVGSAPPQPESAADRALSAGGMRTWGVWGPGSARTASHDAVILRTAAVAAAYDMGDGTAGQQAD